MAKTVTVNEVNEVNVLSLPSEGPTDKTKKADRLVSAI